MTISVYSVHLVYYALTSRRAGNCYTLHQTHANLAGDWRNFSHLLHD